MRGGECKCEITRLNQHFSYPFALHNDMITKCVCVCVVCVCVCVCHHSFVWLGLFLCTLIRYMGVYGYSFLCLVGCFSMIIWTPTVLSVLYACVLYFCICTCSAQLSIFYTERRSRNTFIKPHIRRDNTKKPKVANYRKVYLPCLYKDFAPKWEMSVYSFLYSM